MSARKKKKTTNKIKELSEPMQQCHVILKQLQDKQEASPFLEPVDWEFYQLSDYPEIITHPMDLGTIQTKFELGKYSSPDQFASDVRLVWKNAQLYNRPDSEIYNAAEKLSKFFEKKYVKVKKPTAAANSSNKRRKKDVSGREVTKADRIKFSQLVNQLSGEELGALVDQIQKECPNALNEDDDEEIEIEIDNIDGTTLLSLNAFAEKCVSASGGNKKRK